MTHLEKFGLKVLEEARNGQAFSPTLLLKMWETIDKVGKVRHKLPHEEQVIPGTKKEEGNSTSPS